MSSVELPSPGVIEAPRLVLRPPIEGDVSALFEMRSDPEWAFFGAPGPTTREVVEASVLQSISDSWASGPYVIIELEGEVVGDGVLQVSAQDQTANLGYAVARPRWGMGIATEAARALVKFGFEACQLRKIHARTDPRNVGSVRVLEAIPMQREGLLRQHHVRRGEVVDRALYGVLRREWAADPS